MLGRQATAEVHHGPCSPTRLLQTRPTRKRPFLVGVLFLTETPVTAPPNSGGWGGGQSQPCHFLSLALGLRPLSSALFPLHFLTICSHEI